MNNFYQVRHNEITQEWTMALDILSTHLSGTDIHSKSIKDKADDLSNQLKILSTSSSRKISNFCNVMNEEFNKLKLFLHGYGMSAIICACFKTNVAINHNEALENYDTLLKRKNEQIKKLVVEVENLVNTTDVEKKDADDKEIENRLLDTGRIVAEMERKSNKRYRQYEFKIRQLEDRIAMNEKRYEMKLELQASKIVIEENSKHQKAVERVVTDLATKYKSYLNEYKDHYEQQSRIDQLTIATLKSKIAELSQSHLM